MKGSNLGEFEELVLLTIAALVNDAYSVAVCDELEKHTGRAAKLGVVHAVLNRLEEKGLVKHEKESRRYVYKPAVAEKKAKRTALKQLLATFFEGKPEKLVASLLDPQDQKLSAAEIARIRKLLD